MDELFLTIHQWLTADIAVAAVGSLLWGLVSILFSPCHLASIPLIIGYVAGQQRLVVGRQATAYAAVFSAGLFVSIALVGLACAWLGRMLGDIGPYWTIPVGLILLWVALDMLGLATCSFSGSLMRHIQVRGMWGAWVLGLAYGLLSGSCTFGFLSPILAIITVQEKIAHGLLLIVLFALGHCLPIVVAGGSTALVQRLLTDSSFHRASGMLRKGAGVMVGLLGCWFLFRPFLDAA